MGYIIKKIEPKKSSTRTWKVQYETWTSGKRKITDIPATDYSVLGFNPTSTIEEARDRKNQLNSIEELKRQQERRNNINARLESEKLNQSAYLPPKLVKEFEDTILFSRGDNPKLQSHWATARRILFELQIDPIDWAYRSKAFYDWFSKNEISLSYVQKLRRVLNDWGNFVTRKNGQRFDPIPAPKGNEKERIADKYFDANGGRNQDSDPLSPEELENKKNSIPIEVYNWLYLSVWFGLRPGEIDNISKGIHYDVTQVKNIPILKIYQTKLKAISREKRWKLIPCNLPEQIIGLDIIKYRNIKRPGAKLLKNKFTKHTYLYSGRKNFVDLMLDKGYRLEDISSWLGHQSIERTWKTYQNRLKVRLGSIAS